MEKFQVDAKNDIAEEKYQGPSAAVEAAGHGSIEHLMFGFAGLFSVGIAAFFLKAPAADTVEGARALARRLEASQAPIATLNEGSWNQLKHFALSVGASATRFGGKVIHCVFGNPEAADMLRESTTSINPEAREWVDTMIMNKAQGFGNTLLSHTIGLVPSIRRKMLHADPQLGNAISIGGAAGAAGYIGGWGKAIVLGTAHGNKGKHQFERAKAEIKDLRERNDDLEIINDKLHADYQSAATRLHQIRAEEEKPTPPKFSQAEAPLATARAEPMMDDADEQPHSHAARAEHPMHAAATLQAGEREHHGRIHAHQHDRANAAIA